MNIIIFFLATFGLAFALKEMDGPWDIISRWRNLMMRIPVVGPQFYKLLDCYFCSGTWAGVIIYLLTPGSHTWQFLIIYGLASGAGGLILSTILDRLHRE